MSTPHACLLIGWIAGLGLLLGQTPSGKDPEPAPPAADAGAAQPTPVPTVPYSTKTASSVSTTKQFTVYGGDLELRSAFCMLCEETADSLGRVLKDSGQFVLNVKVVLKTPPDITGVGAPVTLNIGELAHGGFHLQINAEMRTGFRTPDFTRELVKVLLAERILRNHKKLSTNRQKDVLPAWVLTGVAQALDYRARSRPSALFSAVFKRGHVYSLDRLLTADPAQLDALSRGIYETSTCALVLTLLDQPDGPVRFAKFLNALAVENKSDRDLLTQYFPNLATSNSALEKWWSLQMAAMGTPSALETMSVAQTEAELDSALTLLIPGTRKQEAAPPKPAAAPPTPAEEPAAEKKSRGFFGRLRQDPKEESTQESPSEEGRDADGSGQPGSDADAGSGEEPSGSDTSADDARPATRTPSIIPNVFGNSKKVIFGLKKKPKGEDETAETDKPKDEKSKEAATKDAKKPEPPKPPAKTEAGAASKAKTEAPAASISRKPGETRGIGGRPDDLPKAPPPVTEKAESPAADTTARKADEPGADEAQSDKLNPLNPRNWFRKKDEPEEKKMEPEEKTAEASPSPSKPAPQTESKPAPPAKTAPVVAASTSRGPKPGIIPLEDYALIAKRADRAEILTRCLTRLNALKLRAHPLYRPLIADYLSLVEDLRQEKTRGASTKLDGLRQQREDIHKRALAVETHLDWYEANHTGTLSHAFDDFLRLDEELDKERLPRNDDLSKYLDALQAEFK